MPSQTLGGILTNFPSLTELCQWGMCRILQLGGNHGGLSCFLMLELKLALPQRWKTG